MIRSGWYSLLFAACVAPMAAGGFAAEPAPVSLKDAARGTFRIGAALDAALIRGEDAPGMVVVERQFDTITAENAMKWEVIHPQPGKYDFELADRFVDLGVRRRLFVVGHTLMWHSQVPDWVFKDAAGNDLSRDALLARLRQHIQTVVGRYRGRVQGWDVVNEAMGDDGKLRTDKPWYRILGEEGIYAAFEAAHQADPEAELYYNDYSLENPVKSAAVLRLALAIRARGLRIDAIGTQEHATRDWPVAAQVRSMIDLFDQAGFKMMVTELDVSILPRPESYGGADISVVHESDPSLDPYRKGLPKDQQALLARRYGELMAAFCARRGAVTRVTFWGVGDARSWLNDWPIKGRSDYPLLFDRKYRPKPAFAAAIRAIREHAATE